MQYAAATERSKLGEKNSVQYTDIAKGASKKQYIIYDY